MSDMPYETPTEIETRLSARYGITTTITEGDAEIASSELDSMGPFIGSRYDSSQDGAFPRSVEPGGADSDGTMPEAVLDWVALNAYRIASNDAPAVTSWSRSSVSESYARPMPSQSERRMQSLIGPYLLKVGRSLSESYYPRSFESCPDA